MVENSRFSEKQHELAWKMWRAGKSFREISESEGMPSHSMIAKWSRDFDCPYDCEYHNWKEKQAEIMDQALEEVDKELPDPVERDKRRLKNLNQVEETLFNALESGELEVPTTLKENVEILEKVLDMNRLIRGESTEITETRGEEHKHLNISEVLNQLNVGKEISEDELIDAAEKAVINAEE